jgi:hypothetical protein
VAIKWLANESSIRVALNRSTQTSAWRIKVTCPLSWSLYMVPLTYSPVMYWRYLCTWQVTGANGFVGSHIIYQLLEKGYRVRGWAHLLRRHLLGFDHLFLNPRTARGAKIDLIKATFSSYGDKFEVVTVNDVAVHNLSDHLEGVDAVIHAAAPLPGKGDPKALLNVRSLSSKSL